MFMSMLQIKKVFGSKSAPEKVVVKAVAKKAVRPAKAAVMTQPTKAPKSAKVVKMKAPQKVGLVCAQGEQCFWSNDGLILSSLADLSEALATMSDEVYMHHATKDRNDFADWVEFVLIDKVCAQNLRRAKGKKAAQVVVAEALSSY